MDNNFDKRFESERRRIEEHRARLEAENQAAQPTDPDQAMLQAVADYLERNGWKVVVIGSPRVQKQPGEREYNYEFVLRFTGHQTRPGF